MTTTLTDQITEAFPTATSWTSPRGQLHLNVRKGSLLVTFTPQTDGTVAVTMWTDYGDYGRSYHDSGDYKTARGAIRKAQGFLR